MMASTSLSRSSSVSSTSSSSPSSSSPVSSSTLGMLMVQPVRARSLPSSGLVKMDPYCMVSLVRRTLQTPPAPKGHTCPDWSSMSSPMAFPVSTTVNNVTRQLYLQVMDSCKYKDDEVLGTTYMEFPKGLVSAPSTQDAPAFFDWVELKSLAGRYGGQVLVRLWFEPSAAAAAPVVSSAAFVLPTVSTPSTTLPPPPHQHTHALAHAASDGALSFGGWQPPSPIVSSPQVAAPPPPSSTVPTLMRTDMPEAPPLVSSSAVPSHLRPTAASGTPLRRVVSMPGINRPRPQSQMPSSSPLHSRTPMHYATAQRPVRHDSVSPMAPRIPDPTLSPPSAGMAPLPMLGMPVPVSVTGGAPPSPTPMPVMGAMPVPVSMTGAPSPLPLPNPLAPPMAMPMPMPMPIASGMSTTATVMHAAAHFKTGMHNHHHHQSYQRQQQQPRPLPPAPAAPFLDPALYGPIPARPMAATPLASPVIPPPIPAPSRTPSISTTGGHHHQHQHQQHQGQVGLDPTLYGPIPGSHHLRHHLQQHQQRPQSFLLSQAAYSGQALHHEAFPSSAGDDHNGGGPAPHA